MALKEELNIMMLYELGGCGESEMKLLVKGNDNLENDKNDDKSNYCNGR